MRSAVKSCAVSSHMYVVTGCSVWSVDASMYLQRDQPKIANARVQNVTCDRAFSPP